jgi:pyruvate,water dikinase
MKLIYRFSELDNSNVKEAGGKNASLGEMFQQLQSEGIRVPDGFATSADAYWQFIEKNDLKDTISDCLDDLDKKNFKNLNVTGKQIREKILEARTPENIENEIRKAFRDLKDREENVSSVAARSSATAEDLPEASFAGQHDSFMNIKTEKDLLKAWKMCVASLFTDRAIKYREENEFDHMKVALSVGIQKMVRSDKASAGVAFTLDPDSGLRKVILINGAWGLGENVVQGTVRNDEFYVFKHALKEGKKAILSKNLGPNKKMMVFSDHKNGDDTI